MKKISFLSYFRKWPVARSRHKTMDSDDTNSRTTFNFHNHSSPYPRISILYSRWIPIVISATALTLGTFLYSWSWKEDERDTELKAVMDMHNSAELMWGHGDEEFGYPRHKALRWIEKGVNIRDRVNQMEADLRAFDRHIAQQTIMNADYKRAVMAMKAQYKKDKRIVRLMLSSGLIAESNRIDQLESSAIQNVSYLERLVNSIKSDQATDGASASATIAALNTSYNFLNASQELPQVAPLADSLIKISSVRPSREE